MIEIFGYIAAVFIGITLGLIGGGGSILTVPVLVFLFKIKPTSATAYSLFIVGITSGIGSIPFFKRKLVCVQTAVVFGIPSIIAVFSTRAFLLPLLPETFISISSFTLTKDIFIMILFASLMIVTSFSMIKKSKKSVLEEPLLHQDSITKDFNYKLILLEGTIVGALTGLVGAGGGFLIIPALVILGKLPMKKAVGTSLVIIFSKSLIGLLGEPLLRGSDFQWVIVLKCTFMAVLGISLGSFLSTKIDGTKLKPAFGYFVLVMGFYIFVKEIFF
ncbi:hypothetical protein P9112_013064 [Eukaryota sp. TZLM1-RC]